MKNRLVRILCTVVWIICAPFACYLMLGVMRKTCNSYEKAHWESINVECEETTRQIVADVYAEHGWDQ